MIGKHSAYRFYERMGPNLPDTSDAFSSDWFRLWQTAWKSASASGDGVEVDDDSNFDCHTGGRAKFLAMDGSSAG